MVNLFQRNNEKELNQDEFDGIKEIEKMSFKAIKLDDLEEFIGWLNKQSSEANGQFCGLTKLKDSSSYAGFILKRDFTNASSKLSYTLSAYLSCDINHDKVYVACFDILIPCDCNSSEQSAQYDAEKIETHLVDNIILRDGLRRRGIGKFGISIIKAFSKQLGSTRIYGQKRIIGETGMTMEELTNFYDKCGFTQSPTRGEISMDI